MGCTNSKTHPDVAKTPAEVEAASRAAQQRAVAAIAAGEEAFINAVLSDNKSALDPAAGTEAWVLPADADALFDRLAANGASALERQRVVDALVAAGFEFAEATEIWAALAGKENAEVTRERFHAAHTSLELAKRVPRRAVSLRHVLAADLAAFGTNAPGSDAAAAFSWACAVTIGWLIAFTKEHDCWEWETWRVVRDIIKPATAATRCRYVDLPEVRASGAVGDAVTFASHTWGAKWGTLVAALADGGADRNRRVWVDVFAVRQWAVRRRRRGRRRAATAAAPAHHHPRTHRRGTAPTSRSRA